MDEQRKYAILFAATILAARKLNDPAVKLWPRATAIQDAVSTAREILKEVDRQAEWPERTT